MRISSTILILLTVSVSAVTFATEKSNMSMPFDSATGTSAFMCADGCNGAPVAVNPRDGFSLDLAKNLFDSGVEPQLWQLVGNWKMVGQAAVPDEPDWSVGNSFNMKGITNSDGTPQFALSIASGVGTGAKDFAGNPIITAPSVQISGLGVKSLNQGPNEITFNDSHRSACFAQFAYNFNEALVKSHFNFECRLLATDVKKMVCTMTLNMDPTEEQNAWDFVKSWNGHVVAYRAFVKE